MHGRNISFNIRKAIDIMEWVDMEDIPAVATALDFEKAFDRVEMDALVGALRYFNFGKIFIKWIVLLYTRFESCTTNAGYTSEWFTPTRALHRGACESPIIFLSIVEVLGQNLRQSDEVEGITINNVETKSGQFADDTILFSLYKLSSMQATINTLTDFENNSGLKLLHSRCRVSSCPTNPIKSYIFGIVL